MRQDFWGAKTRARGRAAGPARGRAGYAGGRAGTVKSLTHTYWNAGMAAAAVIVLPELPGAAAGVLQQ